MASFYSVGPEFGGSELDRWSKILEKKGKKNAVTVFSSYKNRIGKWVGGLTLFGKLDQQFPIIKRHRCIQINLVVYYYMYAELNMYIALM